MSLPFKDVKKCLFSRSLDSLFSELDDFESSFKTLIENAPFEYRFCFDSEFYDIKELRKSLDDFLNDKELKGAWQIDEFAAEVHETFKSLQKSLNDAESEAEKDSELLSAIDNAWLSMDKFENDSKSFKEFLEKLEEFIDSEYTEISDLKDQYYDRFVDWGSLTYEEMGLPDPEYFIENEVHDYARNAINDTLRDSSSWIDIVACIKLLELDKSQDEEQNNDFYSFSKAYAEAEKVELTLENLHKYAKKLEEVSELSFSEYEMKLWKAKIWLNSYAQFSFSNDEQLQLYELIQSNEIARNRLREIADNNLENKYDFESLMNYLKKKEKKNLINI